MRARIIGAGGAAVALALALPAAAPADTEKVMMENSSFSPGQISVLAGDTVAWHNMSFRDHTVTARDGSFGSPGHIPPNGGYSFRFSASGAFPYVCQVHPFMTGEVDVYPALLQGPKDPISRGAALALDGRAQAGTSSVEIQQDTGSGFATVATAAVDGTGAFHYTVGSASTSARYRALTGGGSSPTVQVVVMDRRLSVSAARRGRRAIVRVRALPRSPGAIVVLQLRLRERFGWWPVARHRLDRRSRATFGAPLGARARVVLTLPDGWTPVVTSARLSLPRRR